jgi:hypothetical protein
MDVKQKGWNTMEKKNLLNWLLGILVFSVSLSVISCDDYGKLETFNGTQVYYKSPITKDVVNKLGEYLIDSEFADGDEKTVQLLKTGNTYEFRMVVKKGIEQDQEYKNIFRFFAAELSEDVFSGAKVDIHLCDEHLKTLVVVPMLKY